MISSDFFIIHSSFYFFFLLDFDCLVSCHASSKNKSYCCYSRTDKVHMTCVDVNMCVMLSYEYK